MHRKADSKSGSLSKERSNASAVKRLKLKELTFDDDEDSQVLVAAESAQPSPNSKASKAELLNRAVTKYSYLHFFIQAQYSFGPSNTESKYNQQRQRYISVVCLSRLLIEEALLNVYFVMASLKYFYQ